MSETELQIDLSGQNALITGASRGIGAAVAKALADAGAHVILMARTKRALEAVDDEIRASGGKATLIPQDLTDLDALDPLGQLIYERFGKLDILIGNAGMLGELTPLPHTDPAAFEKLMTLNVSANFRLIRTLDPLLRASHAGRAVFVSTGERTAQGRAYWGPYSASKAALEALVRSYAAETCETNLRVNGLRPGTVDTKMLQSAFPGGYEALPNVRDPADITPAFLRLCAADCTLHGEIITA